MNKILPLIIISIVLFFGYGLYSNIGKDDTKKSKRLDCQSKTVTFESIYVKKDMKKAQDLLLSNNYKIVSDIEYSKLMSTILIQYFDVNKSDKLLESIIPKSKEIVSDEKLIVDYYIYENDKDDTNKKNKDAKKYAGYLLFEFKLNDKIVYKIQSDYMQQDGSDIKDRMECIIKSFLSI